MVTNWINRVTGRAVVESTSARAPSTLRQVLGEEKDEVDSPKEAEPKEQPELEPLSAPATDAPEAESKAAVDADIEAGAEASADSGVDSQTVEHLVSSWQSGSKMDVASQLMYTPVSYVDFVKMLYRVGEQDGVELGGMLDQLSDARPSTDQPGGQDMLPETPPQEGGRGASRILSRIARRRSRDLPVTEPAGETGPELDTTP